MMQPLISRAALVRGAILAPLLLQVGRPARAAAGVAQTELPDVTTSLGDSPSLQPPVLVIGATGGIGSQVVAHLLQRGVPVRAMIRSEAKLPEAARTSSLLKPVVVGSVLDLNSDQLAKIMQGCGAVVSCLGHDINHMWAEPKMLCRDTSRLVYDAARYSQSSTPLRYVTVSTTGVDSPDGSDRPQGVLESWILSALEAFLPPVSDNVENAKFLAKQRQRQQGSIEFAAVRPDDLVDGPASAYVTYRDRPMGLFDARVATRANVGAFMAELATDEDAWKRWRNSYPVVIDKIQPADRPPAPEGWVA